MVTRAVAILIFFEDVLEEMMKIRCFRFLGWMILLWASSFCFGQVIKIRIINGKNGQPLPKQQVSVSLLYNKKIEDSPAKYDALLHLETDAKGVAQFTLPEPLPEHLSAGVHLTSEHWRGCAVPALVVTKDLIRDGTVQGQALATFTTPVKAEPGEILFIARPFTFFEKLFSPLLKE
jgi:hypothetical protein